MITMTRVQLNVAGYEFYGQAELPQQAKHNASTQVQGGGSSQLSPHLVGHIQSHFFNAKVSSLNLHDGKKSQKLKKLKSVRNVF